MIKKYQIKKRELVFLAALMGENAIIGIEDPFTGWLAEQVTDEWNLSNPTMIEKGYLTLDENGPFNVSTELQDIIRLCCFPDVWLSMNSLQQPDKNPSTMLYFDREQNKLTKLEFEAGSDMVTLQGFAFEGKINEQIISELDLDQKIASKNESLKLSNDDFAKIIATNNGELKDNFKNLNSRFIESFMNAKVGKILTISFSWKENQIVKSIIVIADTESIWRVEMDEDASKKIVNVNESDYSDLSRFFQMQLMAAQ